MSHISGRPAQAPVGFTMIPSRALNVNAAIDRISGFDAREPIHVDGGVEIGHVHLGQEQTHTLRAELSKLKGYGTVSLPGTPQANEITRERYRSLSPRGRELVLAVHTAFRETVRLDAERSGLPAPNQHVARVEAGVLRAGRGIGWHPDSNARFDTREQQLSALQGHGIVRYTLSLLAPGTELAEGTLHPGDIADEAPRTGLEIGTTKESDLQIVSHAAGNVVRFISDHDLHRAPLIENPTPRVFMTTSVALPIM